MAAHNFWRVNIHANNGGSYLSLVDIEMHATIGGANECTGGTVIFSSQYDTNASSSGNAAVNAFDGNSTTKWTASPGATGWIGYQFATPVDIVELSIMGPISGQSTYAPKDFTFEYSDDGVSWIGWDVINSTAWGALEVRTFTEPVGTAIPKVTQQLVEVARTSAAVPKPRVTQQLVEVVRTSAAVPKPRVTQQLVEVIHTRYAPPSDNIITQFSTLQFILQYCQ